MLKKKSYLLTLLFGLLCSFGAKAQTVSGAEVIPVDFPYSTCYFVAMSDNGDWAVASGTEEENTTNSAYPYLVNARTGELIQLWTEGDPVGYTANDVTNDGKMVVGSHNGAAYYDVDARTWVQLPVSSGSGAATCVTPDGSRIGGWGSGGALGGDDYVETPLLWERQSDGTYRQVDITTELKNFPFRDKSGSSTAIRRIENISADGNILAGSMNFIYPNLACYYVYNCTTQEYSYIDSGMADYGCQSGSFIDQSNMSNDGTYITGQAYCVIGADEYTSAYRYNISTGEFILYNSFSDERDRGGNAVTNDGVVFATSPAVSPTRYNYVRVGNLWYGIDEILSGRYGINIYEKLNQEYSGLTMDVSDDGRVITAMSMATGNGYILRLPETFAEAASHIDPFAAYTISPTEGSSFARFREATITFSKPTTLSSSTAQARLLDASGNAVSGGQRTISANADGVSFTVGGRPVTLQAGETYTLNFPAGTFVLAADNSFVSPEINIQYTGRENTPTVPLEISPADGTNVSEISTNNPVAIAFDLNIKVATDAEGNAAVGYLYEGDSDTPVCTLTLSATGQALGMAPALTRYLRLGIDYRVVLPAGSVTDIMGDCGNEEIVINYHGVYEQPISQNADLFFDNFDNPATSLATFLFYEGDHNTPASVPEQWQFNADNYPWTVTLRETENDTDYFAASHSMYNPAGKSDDWMSIPQLYIENSDFYLSFKAQSYLFTANDVLRVIALEADEGYNTFTDDLYQRFQTEGRVIFEEQLTPGASQDGVYNDWTDYEVSLADFAGKSVYLAFVNQNEDQSAIFLDSVRVYFRGDFVLNNSTASAVVNAESVPVSVRVMVTGDNTYNELTATCTNADGSFTSTVTASGLGLTKESAAYTVQFPEELPLTVGVENAYTVTVTLDGNRLSNNGTVKNLAFETTKRVVIEEATGEGCGNCPDGILAFERIESLFGEQFIPIGVHCNVVGSDRYAYDNYVSYLGLSAAPTGLVNRIDTVYSPIVYYIDENYNNVYSFNSQSGNETWLDIVQRELTENPIADADITITKADMNSETRQIDIEGSINYAVNLNSLNQRLVLVILENQLVGTQNNYRYTATDPIFGEWGQGGAYGQATVNYVYDHVARRVIDESYAGLSGIIPISVTAGEPVSFDIERSAYDNVTNWANAEVVAMLVNANTGRIENANKVAFTVDGVTGIGSVNAGSGNIGIAVAGNQIVARAAGGLKMSVYDASGSLVGTASGNGTANVTAANGGLYIVKVKADGANIVKKVIVR